MPSFALKHPLPSLPTETYSHILSFCDGDTLGRASLVSLAFLELASPHLYGHIIITGLAQLNRLFYSEERVSSAPHLDHLLSLDQTRTFTFVGTPEDPDDPVYSLATGHPDRLFSKKRSTCTYPVRVDTLVARFFHPGENQLFAAGDIHGHLLSLFSPTRAILSAVHPSERRVKISWVVLDDAPWHALRSLSVSNSIWSRHFSRAPFLTSLPPRSLTIVFDLGNVASAPSVEWTMLDHLSYDLTPWADERGTQQEMLAPEWPQVKELIVKIAAADQAEDVIQAVHDAWDEAGTLGPEERDRREAMIRFVAV